MQNLIAGFMIFLFALNASGCATVAASLPSIIAAIQDSALVISQIESFVNLYFQMNPNPAKQTQVADAIARVKTALEAAQRLADGTQKLDQGQVDAAFVDIRNAYTDLVALCGSFGIGVKMTGKSMKATTGPGRTLTVPEPLIFAGKV